MDAIPKPPAWAVTLVWLDEEIETARKMRDSFAGKGNEEKRIYYESRYATLVETRLHMKGVLV